MVWAVHGSAHELALRYLLELSADIRGALLLDRGGRLLASAGHLQAGDLAGVAGRLAAAAGALSPNGAPRTAIEIDVFSDGGVMFLVAEADHVMSCVTNRSVNPGLIFYDMHAVLRDLDRAAAAEALRQPGGGR